MKKLFYTFQKKIVILIFLGLLSCSSENSFEQNEAQLIDMSQIDKNQRIDLNKFVKDVRFLTLETDKYFFAEITKLIIKNDRIYLLDGFRGKIILIFNLEGKFMLAITMQGDGPGEYRSPSDLWVNSDGSIEVLDEELRKIITYSDKGNFIKEIKLPFPSEKFVKTDENYLFFTNNISFSFNEDSNETALVALTNHSLNQITSMVPADLQRADFYYITKQNFTEINKEWYFVQPFSSKLINLSGGDDFIFDFGKENFPNDFFATTKKDPMGIMTDLYNLGRVWDFGLTYELDNYIYFKYQINLTIFMGFMNKENQVITLAKRDNWIINSNCIVSRFDPITSYDNQLVFHLLPNQIKMLKDLNCFDHDQIKDIDENNVLMLWNIK